jgi:hypothetical protein
MAKGSLTFEQVDRIVAKANLTPFRAGGAGRVRASAVSASPGDVLVQICGIWQIVGPIVRLLLKSPFLPKKWRDALELFANAMDTICENA